MPNLPQRKVGIVACSGEELPDGTVTRLAALRVLEELRPAQTVTICLPLFLAGGEGDRAFAKFYPTIAVDGCGKRCAARATELYSNKPAASIVVDQLLDERGLPRPKGCRYLSEQDRRAVEAVAEAIAAEVDHLTPALAPERSAGASVAVRCPVPESGYGVGEIRAEGAVIELTPATAVSTAACACGSGIPVTTVQVDGQSIQLMALEPIFEMAYGQGLRADGPLQAGVPAQILETARVYNQVPEGKDALYASAVSMAWRDYCARRETANG